MLENYSDVLTESHLKNAVRGKYAQSIADNDTSTVKIIGGHQDRYVTMKTIEVEAIVNNEGQSIIQTTSNRQPGKYKAVIPVRH